MPFSKGCKQNVNRKSVNNMEISLSSNISLLR